MAAECARQQPRDLRDVGHVVRPQGRGDQVQDQTALRIEGRQQMGDGKTAALLLPARLAEAGLQGGGVGHRAARAVDQDRAMAMPEARTSILLRQRADDAEDQRRDQL